MGEASLLAPTASIPFQGVSCAPTLLATKGEATVTQRRVGLPGGSQALDLGYKGGAHTEYRPEVCAQEFTGKLPAEKSTHASPSAWPCLTRGQTGQGVAV